MFLESSESDQTDKLLDLLTAFLAADSVELQREPDVSFDISPRQQLSRCVMYPTMRSIERTTGWLSYQTRPADGFIMPAAMLSRVLFPQPDGPTIATNSPWGS